MNAYNLTVIIKKDTDGNFLAICPALQGCYVDGETQQEALSAIEDVIKMHIESRLGNNELIPEEIYSKQMRIMM